MFEPGSFKDPSGRVFINKGKVYRFVSQAGQEDYEFTRATGLIDDLISSGKLVSEQALEQSSMYSEYPDTFRILEHPHLNTISYPWEWHFSLLKEAALLQLDICIESLNYDVALSDATPLNIQFNGPVPVFIDSLSFVKYQSGDYWAGHNQFCRQFLNPLLLYAKKGVPFNYWIRGSLDGIDPQDLTNILGIRSKLSPTVFMNVVLQSRF